MNEYSELEKRIENAGYEIFWLGPTSSQEINRLEILLGRELPSSFKIFLQSYGGGGIVSAEVSGIEDNDAAKDTGGTVLGDTNECRNRYSLPDYLVVIYFHDDEVCWCLDTSQLSVNECPVVSFNLFSGKIDRVIAPNFSSFMKEHLSLYGDAAGK